MFAGFVEAMRQIRAEVRDIESGKVPRDKNVLKGAPHTASVVCADEWNRPYSRDLAAFPTRFSAACRSSPCATSTLIEGANRSNS